MPSQIGVTRVYTDTTEATDTHKKQCSLCKVFAVPRGITTSRTHGHKEEGHCPNCGHVHGRKNH